MAVRTGEPAPFFYVDPDCYFESAEGRYLVLTFFNGFTSSAGAALLADLSAKRVFDGLGAALFVVTDPNESTSSLLDALLAGIKVFLDDGAIARHYVVRGRGNRAVSNIVSPRQQVIGLVAGEPATHAALIFALLRARPHPQRLGRVVGDPLVLIIPHIRGPRICRELIAAYERHGGRPSGFKRDVAGRTVEITDRQYKVRRDWSIEQLQLKAAIRERSIRRVVPAIAKSHQRGVTCMERCGIS
ncbi:hypothetical protein SAMN07250955_11543 [Arboricoccus pini]|uniref:Uncharacterized protein n=1 Tax=Arboricoccus pini TaxID=1963835 RepID=A0A212RV89_9PROT|nr:hypothetical protein [Arboricoccus pini]SNB76596.1 hypothetical protein SAMN07250955_11543 [Arboricoccus pini]